MKKIRQVAVSGYYGQGNFGDDVFCIVTAWGIQKYWKMETRFLSTRMPVMPKEIFYSALSDTGFKGYALLKSLIDSIQSDYVLFSGGSLFHSKPSSIVSPFFWHHQISKVLPKYGAMGVSIGPFSTQKNYEWIRQMLNNFVFISVRDNQSFKTLSRMNLHGKAVQSFDLAVLCPKISPISAAPRNRKERYVLGVNICHYERFVNGDSRKEEQRETNIVCTLQRVLERNPDVYLKIFSLNSHPFYGDNQLSHYIEDQLVDFKHRFEIIQYANNPLVTWAQLQECDMVLGVRLHSCILAYSANIPFILFEYHPKCTDFLDSINYPPLYRQKSEVFDPQDLATTIYKILHMDRKQFFEPILPLEIAQDMAVKNFTMAPWAQEKADHGF
jgi:polysaccharide pyruvyl transferase WcaK-like protein